MGLPKLYLQPLPQGSHPAHLRQLLPAIQLPLQQLPTGVLRLPPSSTPDCSPLSIHFPKTEKSTLSLLGFCFQLSSPKPLRLFLPSRKGVALWKEGASGKSEALPLPSSGPVPSTGTEDAAGPRPTLSLLSGPQVQPDNVAGCQGPHVSGRSPLHPGQLCPPPNLL